MREAIHHVGTMFGAARLQKYAEHPLADFIRNELRDALEACLAPEQVGLIIKGSAGSGRWADVPWAAVFDPFVTTTATRG